MNKFGALIISVGVTIVLLLSGTAPAWAAASQGVSLTTSPVSVSLLGTPGSPITTTLQVMNNDPQPLQINLQLETFRASGTSGQGQIIEPGANDGFIKWVTFSKNSFIAQPGVWIPIKMTINLPSYAALGYYYAVIFKPSVPVTAKVRTDVIKGSNAVLVLLNAQVPNEHPQVKVTSFTSLHGVYEYLPAIFTTTVYNNGNIYLAPTGDIYISNSSNFKKIIDTIDINPAGGNVLQGTSRSFTSKWTDGFPVFTQKTLSGQPVTNSQGQPIYNLKWDFSQANKFRFGKYYAKMVLVYNNGSRDVPIVATVSFWVIPWKLILLAIFLLVVIIGLIYLLVSSRRKLKKQTKWRA